MTDAPRITIVHPTALLDASQFGARALAFLDANEIVEVSANVDGFLRVRRDGSEGYVPAALCEPLAFAPVVDTRVVQPVLLYDHPTPGAQHAAPWIISPDEPLVIHGNAGQFVQIQRANGQIGYVPTTVVAAPLLVAGQTVQTQRAVHFYHAPGQGDHFDPAGMVVPDEPLLMLGKDGRFVLIQREGGQLGYVPAVLCATSQEADSTPIHRVDLKWVALGLGWFGINWLALVSALSTVALQAGIGFVFGLVVLVVVVVGLWFSPRKLLARSFASGVLLAYALLHLLSGGALTLWR